MIPDNTYVIIELNCLICPGGGSHCKKPNPLPSPAADHSDDHSLTQVACRYPAPAEGNRPDDLSVVAASACTLLRCLDQLKAVLLKHATRERPMHAQLLCSSDDVGLALETVITWRLDQGARMSGCD